MVSWPVAVRAACEPDPELGFICDPAGQVAVGLVGSTSDSGLRRTIALAVTEELLEDDASETGGGSGDGSPFDVYISLLYGDQDYEDNVLTAHIGGAQSNVQGIVGLTSDTWGGVLGVNFRGTGYFVGVALDYADEDADFKANAGSRDTEELGIQVYGTYYPLTDKRLFFSAVARYASLDINTERTFLGFEPDDARVEGATAQTPNVVRGSTDGSNYGLFGGAGYSWPFSRQTRLLMSAWLSWQDNQIDGYTETGALPQSAASRPANLRYDDDNYSTLDGSLTVTLLHEVPISSGRLVPSVSLGYIHEFESDMRIINAELIDFADVTNDPTKKFVSFQTNAADKDYLRIGASLTAQLKRGTSLYAAYSGTFGHDWRDESSFGIGFSQTF